MKISELLDAAAIAPELTGEGKAQILGEMVDVLVQAHPEVDREEALAVIREREQLGSTGIGEGVAIPHGKLRGIKHLLLAFGRHRTGVDFDAIDGTPTHFFFLLLAPEGEVTAHLKALARISKILRKDEVRRRLMEAGDRVMLQKILAQEDELV